MLLIHANSTKLKPSSGHGLWPRCWVVIGIKRGSKEGWVLGGATECIFCFVTNALLGELAALTDRISYWAENSGNMGGFCFACCNAPSGDRGRSSDPKCWNFAQILRLLTMWVGMQSSGDFPRAVMWSEEWHGGRGSFEKCDENLKLGWKHLSPHLNCPESSQLQMKCNAYQAKLVLIYSRKRTLFATVQWKPLTLQQTLWTWFKAFYKDKKIMQLCISKGLQVQLEVVIHASRVANVAANLMDLVTNKLQRENFKCSGIS